MRSLDFSLDELPIVRELPLITAKPLVFACNVDSDSYLEGGSALASKFQEYVAEKYPGAPIVVLCSLLEQEILQIRAEDGEEAALEYMELSGIEESALERLLEECSNVLGL